MPLQRLGLHIAYAGLLTAMTSCGAMVQKQNETLTPRHLGKGAGSLLSPESGDMRGSFRITFEDLDEEARRYRPAGTSRVFLQEIEPWKPTPLPGSKDHMKIFHRVIFYDIHDKAGINDRLYVMMRMMSLAHTAKAALAFPGPDKLLGHSHGDTGATLWDEYFTTVPRVELLNEVKCDKGVKEIVVWNPSLLLRFPPTVKRLLADVSRPLCLRITVKYAEFKRPKGSKLPSDAAEFMETGSQYISVWTSPKVNRIFNSLRKTADDLSKYNMVHVRLGDKATPRCSNPNYIVDKVQSMLAKYPQNDNLPWLVMSDGEEAFLRGLVRNGRKQGINFITEKEFEPLASLKDNYLRYTVLECIFGGAELALSNFKDHGQQCKVRPHHQYPTRFIGC